MTACNSGPEAIGATFSPRPVQSAGPRSRKKLTSLPISAATFVPVQAQVEEAVEALDHRGRVGAAPAHAAAAGHAFDQPGPDARIFLRRATAFQAFSTVFVPGRADRPPRA